MAAWKEISGHEIKAYVGDLCDPTFVHQMVGDFGPDTIVHFGEQRAALSAPGRGDDLDLDVVAVEVAARVAPFFALSRVELLHGAVDRRDYAQPRTACERDLLEP